jgi:hypothetical protein
MVIFPPLVFPDQTHTVSEIRLRGGLAPSSLTVRSLLIPSGR